MNNRKIIQKSKIREAQTSAEKAEPRVEKADFYRSKAGRRAKFCAPPCLCFSFLKSFRRYLFRTFSEHILSAPRSFGHSFTKTFFDGSFPTALFGQGFSGAIFPNASFLT